ncbi:dynein regulatory complex subunit 2 [Phymastichus coffea]|uniref:dynein regulatory complex subunit 2 n=1 Tax=Phymastichus coffea TaxID=108790 RepID=UPI00273B8304|nr:dynein regulatory complex subunit 2 [Phymastichus coffea]
MTDDERARYLQHRADIELEAKRRKQQLIAIFTKNKLKREEAFARINTAKLNEQWRTALRHMKYAELKTDVEYLYQDFEEVLKTKDDYIQRLFDELVQADLDHRRFQEAHMMALDDIIDKGKERINHLHDHYVKAVNRIRTEDLQELRSRKVEMKNSLMHLRTIIFSKRQSFEEELTEMKTRNAVSIHNIVYSKEESIINLKRSIYPRMEGLWQELNDVITNYENSTENKRKQYEYLKEQDDVHQVEASEFPKLYTQLREHAETSRKNLLRLTEERQETIEDLKHQSELLTKRLCKLRQEMKMMETLDAVQLKKLSVLSSEAIANLERILNKGNELHTMMKLCSDLEPEALKVKRYSIKNLEVARELTKPTNEPFGFFKKIEAFRDHLYCLKEENSLLRQKRNNLLEENNRLKHSLRTYLTSVSRMPTIRPGTRV